MERTIKALVFLIFATPLWALIALGVEKLEGMYGKISPEILYFVYPTLAVALITALFLWKVRLSLPEFAVLLAVAPLVVSIALSVVATIQDIHSNSYHSDDPGFFIFFLFYLFPVVSFLLGAAIYHTITRLKEGAQ